MKLIYNSVRISCVLFLTCFLLFAHHSHSQTISFSSSKLQGSLNTKPTSLQFGPDDRLYVAQHYGVIYAYTIQRFGPNDYQITDSEQINIIKLQTPNHDDDGTYNATKNRQLTGIYVTGTAENPIIYASSSDWRVGAGGGGNDIDLDTNSGILHKLTWNGSSWEKVDLIRGLPRAEENHSVSAMMIDPYDPDVMYLTVGGNTNAGAPSNNFAFSTEYAYSASIVKIDLPAIEAMPVQTSMEYGYTYHWVYDLPTVDDPTHSNISSNDGYTDANDPFGGNDGLNQAKIDPNSPVQIHSPGWRNVYDFVITTTPGREGRMYAVDNGANGSWGGHAEGEADYPAETTTALVTNKYIVGEPGSTDIGPGGDPAVNNQNGLHYIRPLVSGELNYVEGDPFNNQMYYAGHPTPIRGNPAGAGLYTKGDHTINPDDGTDAYWRNEILLESDPNFSTQSLPVDWPPVPLSMANPAEGDFRNSGETDGAIANYGPSTNGICEYTASNFDGAMQGDLLMAGFLSSGPVYRVILSADGKVADNCPDLPSNCTSTFATGIGSLPLDVIAQGDDDIFPGTVWAVTYEASNNITVFEPADYDGSVFNCEATYSFLVDSDNDGYTDADEMDNGTDPCSGAEVPDDFDKSEIGGFLVSNLNDSDDDDDGIEDLVDSFQWDANNGAGSNSSVPYYNDLFNAEGYGFGNIGMTGLMTNGSTMYTDQFDADAAIFGGTAGLFTVTTTVGDVTQNNQDNGFQFGVNVGTSTGTYIVKTKINAPFFNNATPQNYQSLGMFMGTGDQDNYLKLVLTANAGSGGLAVYYEEGGTPMTSPTYNISNLLSATEIELALVVDPVAGTVQPQYSLDKVTYIDLGPVINLSGNVLAAAQGTYSINGVASKLAVGTISTSYSANPAFAATWDYFEVSLEGGSVPLTVNSVSDQTNTEGDAVNLTVTASGGIGDYTFGATGLPTGLSIDSETGVISGTISSGAATGSPYTASVIVSDNTNSETVEFTWTVNTSGGGTGTEVVIARINAGENTAGDEYTDGSGNEWSLDNYFTTGAIYPSTASTASIAGTEDDFLYQTERSGVGGWQYQIPVPASGTYRVNLHFAEIYWTVAVAGGGVGSRVFDIAIEGNVVLDNYDILSQTSGATAIIETVEVEVTDGVLNISGIPVSDQAKISAIEVIQIDGETSTTPITITDIATQTNTEGDAINLSVAATGGSGNYTYSATGLPAGVDIEPTNGHIFGTVSAGAAASSPYNVVITVEDNDLADISSTTSFSWVVNESGTGGTSNVVIARINAGENTAGDEYTDVSGNVWSLDSYATGGNIFPATPSAVAIAGTEDDLLYQTERTGPSTWQWHYQIPVPASGTYRVKLHFAEIYWTVAVASGGVGSRVFDVTLEGNVALDNYDILAEVPGATAVIETIDVEVTDGILDIEGIPVVNQAKISAIEVIQLNDETTPDPLAISNIANQTSDEGAAVNLSVSATGGSGSYTYGATGLPSGLSINSSGVISGTIATGAAVSSPYTVNVTVNDGTDNVVESFSWVVNSTSTGGDTDVVIARINAGENTAGDEYTDVSGNVWSLDSYATGGNIFPATPSAVAIAGTEDDLLYQTERTGPSTWQWHYQIPVPESGTYRVNLHFAEIYWTVAVASGGVGSRVFDVTLEGNVALDDYDILAEVPGATAVIETIDVEVTDGILDIEGIPVVNQAKISAIEVIQLAEGSASSRVANNELQNQKSETYTNPISIYPNPTDAIVNIEVAADENESAELIIFDAIGKTIYSEVNTGSFKSSINLAALGRSKGMYIIKVMIGSKSPKIRKIILN